MFSYDMTTHCNLRDKLYTENLNNISYLSKESTYLILHEHSRLVRVVIYILIIPLNTNYFSLMALCLLGCT